MERSGSARIVALVVGVVGAVAVGALTALQARLNGELGAVLADGFLAAAISFGSGLAVLVVLGLALPSGRAGLKRIVAERRAGRLDWWLLCGGAAGAFSVATQGLTVGAIGVALFSVGMIAGQTVGGLVLDRTGYSPAGVTPVTPGRLVGAALVVAAVVVSLGGAVGSVPAWMLALPFLVGVGVSWQTATNGRLRQRAGSALAATAVNFAGGTALLAVVAGFSVAVRGWPEQFPTAPAVYAGGVLGVTYIFISAALTPRTGVLVMTLGSVVGMLASSVVFDLVWPPEADPDPVRQAAMIVLAAAGVAVAIAPRRGFRTRG
ncbi:DMT family transporter [Microbacterium sp. ZXX196]|uniref:DMT family transporter n=1 Tax=Microbacterium sp. ZXX196 TaxID=2609291 RepID=UPI0012B808F2|nr:DMT family transporter [Microbacterium sp. ZXX196]MTE23426.1 EamA-like transporter family protein [Microbacterium sp. ZXX196]